MGTYHRGDAAAAGQRPQLAAVAGARTQWELVEGLREIASAYGHVKSVRWLPSETSGEAGQRYYLVDFDRSADATAASRAMHAYLFGVSTVVVVLPPTTKEAAS